MARGLLPTANDWKLRADLKRKLVFPEEILSTNLRPDIVMWSPNTKQVVIVELTVPWEERIEEANERKRLKYSELQADCASKGWKTYCYPVEIGTRGFAGQSLWRLLSTLGIVGNTRKKAIKTICDTAVKASQWIFSKKDENWE